MSVARLAKSAIKIPKRIERGPTDILKVLSSTVRFSPDQPEPRLADDPFMLPQSSNFNKIFIASRLSGVKAAKFFLNKYPEIFYRDDAEPKIAAFMPPEEFKPEMDFTEEDLEWTINNIDLVNAEIAFNALQEKGAKLSDETVMKLFEMLCFTNGHPITDHIDRQMTALSGRMDSNIGLWSTAGLAPKIFNQIKDDINPPRVYSAMIAGLTKHSEHAAAFELFEKYQQKYPESGLLPPAYSGLISSIKNVYSSTDSSEKALDGIVRHMEMNLVEPDLLIFNAILLFSCSRPDEHSCRRAFQIFNDMQALGIEPSLTSYADLVQLALKSKLELENNIIEEILAKIQLAAQSATIRDPRDTQALEVVMRALTVFAKNLKLADRVFAIYLKKPMLVSDLGCRYRFYQNYFRLMVTTGNMERTCKFYEDYAPQFFTPHPDVFLTFADMLDLYHAPKDFIIRVGLDFLKTTPLEKIKDDEIFRKHPEYVAAYNEIVDKPQRRRE